MNTTENNKLIAEFMGNEWHRNFFKDVFIISTSNLNYKFNTDWNWLMEVVQKINDQNNVVQIHENHVMVVSNTKGEVIVDVVSGSMLEATYQAVVQYIKLKK